MPTGMPVCVKYSVIVVCGSRSAVFVFFSFSSFFSFLGSGSGSGTSFLGCFHRAVGCKGERKAQFQAFGAELSETLAAAGRYWETSYSPLCLVCRKRPWLQCLRIRERGSAENEGCGSLQNRKSI